MAKTLGPAGAEKGTIKEGVKQTVEKATIREADQEPVVVETLPYYNPEITGEKPGVVETLPYYYPVITGEEPVITGEEPEYKSKLPYYHYPDLLPKFPDLPKFPEDFNPFPEDKFPIEETLPIIEETGPVCHEPHPENKLPIDLDPDKEPGHEIIFPERNYPGLPGFPDRRDHAINFAKDESQELIGGIDSADLTRKRAEQAESLVQDIKSSIELDGPQAGE